MRFRDTGRRIGGFQGLREEGGESLTHGDVVSVWGDGKDLWMVVIVHNHVKVLSATEPSTKNRLRTFLVISGKRICLPKEGRRLAWSGKIHMPQSH